MLWTVLFRFSEIIIKKAKPPAAESIPDICTSGQSQDTSNRKSISEIKV